MAKIDKISSDDLEKGDDEIVSEDMVTYFTEEDLDNLENDVDEEDEKKEKEKKEKEKKVLSPEDMENMEELEEGSLDGWNESYTVLHGDTLRVVDDPDATVKDKDSAKESEDIATKKVNRLHDEMNRVIRKLKKEGKDYKEEKEFIEVKQEWIDARNKRLKKIENGEQENILEDLGLDLSAEDIEKEIQHELDRDMIKIKKESRKEIEKFLKSLKIEFSEDEQNRIIENVENTLSEAIDEEAVREFSKLGYHGKVIAAGVGVGAAAAGITMAMKMTGAGMIGKFVTVASGTVVGASGGALRAFIKKKLNPQIEKIKKKNKKKFNEIREKKMKEIINSDLIKTLFIQEIRRSSVIKMGGEEAGDEEYLRNIREFLKVFQATKGLSEEERENLSKAISVLNTIGKKNEKEAVREIKKMNKILKGASIGAVFGAIADTGRYFKLGNNTILISGALGGAMMGGTIDAFLEKHFDKKHEKEILNSIEDIIEKIGKKEEKSPDELAQLKAVVQSKKLEKYPHILEQARHILSTELLKSVSQKTDEMFSGELAFVNEEKVSDREKNIQKKFDSKVGKWTRKIGAYSLGVVAGITTGLMGREAMAYFRGEGGGSRAEIVSQAKVNGTSSEGARVIKETTLGASVVEHQPSMVSDDNLSINQESHKIFDDALYRPEDIQDPLEQYEKRIEITDHKGSNEEFSRLYSQENADYVKSHPDADSVQADDNAKHFSFEKEDTSHDIAAFQEIKGNVDTYSEAAYEAVKKAPTGVQDNFIHRYLDNDVDISNANREELLIKTTHLLSVANLKMGDGNDVQNLVYEGNVGVLKNNGEFEIMKGEAYRDAQVVSHEHLQATAHKIHEHLDRVDKVLDSRDYIKERVLKDVSNAGLNVEDYGAIKDMSAKEFLRMSSTEIANKISVSRVEHDSRILFHDWLHSNLDNLDYLEDDFYKKNIDAIQKLQEELRSASNNGSGNKSVGDVLRERVVRESGGENKIELADITTVNSQKENEIIKTILENRSKAFHSLNEDFLEDIDNQFNNYHNPKELSFEINNLFQNTELKTDAMAENLKAYFEVKTNHNISPTNLTVLKDICHDLKFGNFQEKIEGLNHLTEYIKLAREGELAGTQVKDSLWRSKIDKNIGDDMILLGNIN